jgi:hypothetical protein
MHVDGNRTRVWFDVDAPDRFWPTIIAFIRSTTGREPVEV